MKLDRAYLERIIEEELERTLRSLRVPIDKKRTRDDPHEQPKCCYESRKGNGAKRVPGCSTGNPYHDMQGRFTSPSESPGSWSLRNAPSRPSCQAGQAKRPNKGRGQQLTRIKCGRGERYRCKDGSAKWGTGSIQRSRRDERIDDFERRFRERLSAVLRRYESHLSESNHRKLSAQCNRAGFLSFKQYLEKQNLLAKAEKGDLHKNTE